MANGSERINRLIRAMLVLLLAAGLLLAMGSCRRTDAQGDPGPGPGNSEVAEQADELDYDVPEERYDTGDSDYDSYGSDNGAPYYPEDDNTAGVVEDGEYTTAAEVAEYIHTYRKLPRNYVTKKEAEEYGWQSNECPEKYGIMIGGMKFGNREKRLPKGKYRECDVDYDGSRRGRCRLVYTDDGKVYHTTDHYKTFTQLY